MNKKIDLQDPTAWQSFDWGEKEVHPDLKRTDAQVAHARANKLKADNPEFRKNVSLAKTGVKRPDLTGDNNPNRSPAGRLRMSERMKGVPKSKEQIEKFKEAYKQLPMIVCPHCGFEGRNKGNMNRYHFDNCPNNPKKKK
jgi:ssDNA-binding Zn-finger/Zn-ribbon topoisomerase 1